MNQARIYRLNAGLSRREAVGFVPLVLPRSGAEEGGTGSAPYWLESIFKLCLDVRREKDFVEITEVISRSLQCRAEPVRHEPQQNSAPLRLNRLYKRHVILVTGYEYS